VNIVHIVAALALLMFGLIVLSCRSYQRHLENQIKRQQSQIGTLTVLRQDDARRYDEMHRAFVQAHENYITTKNEPEARRSVDRAVDILVAKAPPAPTHKRVTVEAQAGHRNEPAHVTDAMIYSAPPNFSDSSYDSGSCSSSDSSSSSSSSGSCD